MMDKIINLINRKKSEGYKYLFDHYYFSLCSYSLRFVKNKQDAEDIVQDVFLRLWKGTAKFDTSSSLKAFLYLSVKNASLNHLRYLAKFLNEGFDGKHTLDIQLEVTSVEQILIEEEYFRHIYLGICKLSPERKKIILLSMKGLANKEIAQSLGVSINTIKTLKRKAYQFLRCELSPDKLS